MEVCNGGKGASDAGLRQVFGWYKLRAARKGLVFSLTIDTFSSLISMPCYYCGAAPSNVARHDSKYAQLKYSGIDRYLNDKGYTYSNSLPCCGICNTMKSNLSFEAFAGHISQITQHLKLP